MKTPDELAINYFNETADTEPKVSVRVDSFLAGYSAAQVQQSEALKVAMDALEKIASVHSLCAEMDDAKKALEKIRGMK